MKKLLVAMMMMVAVAGFAQQQVRDVKNFKFADGACYYINPQKSALPILKDGYWGNTPVRWDSSSASQYVHVTVNGVEKTLFLVGKTPDRQTQQYLLVKMSNGILKAFALTDPTPEQLKECFNNRKAFEYGNLIEIQDGINPCNSCKGTGKKTARKTVSGRNGNVSLVDYQVDCGICQGKGNFPKKIHVPGIKIID